MKFLKRCGFECQLFGISCKFWRIFYNNFIYNFFRRYGTERYIRQMCVLLPNWTTTYTDIKNRARIFMTFFNISQFMIHCHSQRFSIHINNSAVFAKIFYLSEVNTFSYLNLTVSLLPSQSCNYCNPRSQEQVAYIFIGPKACKNS